MAAVPQSLVENPAQRSSSEQRKAPTSHGRGGAGNIGQPSPALDPVSLETPTLKSQIYTTGRGGSGNMAKNTDPEEARRAQDVTPQPRRKSSHSQNTHIGRGGAANVFKPTKEELEKAQKDGSKWESAISSDDKVEHGNGNGSGNGSGEKKDGAKGVKGLAEKGKEFLFGKK